MGNENDAIDLLQPNYEAVEEQMDSGARGIGQAATLDVIALGYIAIGDLKMVGSLLDMGWLYRCLLTILELSKGADSEDLVVPLLGLDNLLMKKGKAKDTENPFIGILNVYTKLCGENDGRVGMAMCSLAHVKCAKGEALDCLVSIQTKLGKDNIELLELLKRVLAIQEKAFGYERVGVALELEFQV
ncbi:hypothetical protein HYC85_013474 [Camellia sinensis]|uniref:Uncharacterized protein n=1 Tax=Camellia sinensis TaxID=4442 RepID=A0A7J7H4P2_CAMSI|nr:hypothetical protein HYC85_013474 [Camellia sinensis]